MIEGGSGKPKTERKSVPLSRWKPSQDKGKAGISFFHCTFLIKESKDFVKKVIMDKGSDFKHFGVGNVLDVVLFADMLDGRVVKRLFCVPIPFCYHCVTMSSSVVPVICFSSVLVSYFKSPNILFCRPLLTDKTIGIWFKPLPRMLVMCLSKSLWWQYFLYLKKNTVDF